MSAQSKTTAHLVAEAKSHVVSLSPEEVATERRHGDALLVDIGEAEERAAHGSIRSAIHVPRGMLEFAADPTSAYFRDEFDPGRRTILFCASGGRSALAAEALQTLGYAGVAYLEGGLQAWREAGLPVEPASSPSHHSANYSHAPNHESAEEMP
jgi:rhodanese-related sulfurtransferase